MIEWRRQWSGSWRARVGDGLWAGFVGKVIGPVAEPRPWCASVGNRNVGHFATREEAIEAIEAVFIADLDSGVDWATPTLDEVMERTRRAQ